MITEADVLSALAKRYPSPGYAFLQHVRNRTGYGGAVRTADALAMSLWPSHGMHLHGFEVKVSRSDWVREIKSPEKADEIAKFCDRWWVAVSDETIVKNGELPETFGLLVMRDGKLVQKVEAKVIDAPPMPRTLLAAILRNATDSLVPIDTVETRARELSAKLVEDARADERYKYGNAARDLDAIRDTVAKFETASGVSVQHPWEMANIGAAVKAIVADRRAMEYSALALESARNTLSNAIKTIDKSKKEAKL